MNRRKRQCFFCGEKATEAIDLHHRIPQSISRSIPRLVRTEVLDEIFGKNAQRLYPLCGSCHRKLHSVLKPFVRSLLLLSDINNPWKDVVRQKMKDKVLVIVGVDGKKEEVADVERVVSKLEMRGVNREESMGLLADLRSDGVIYFETFDKQKEGWVNPSLINKITFDHESVTKARKRLRT